MSSFLDWIRRIVLGRPYELYEALREASLSPSAKPPSNGELVAVWFAIGVLFALLVGTAAGFLRWRCDHSLAAALLTAGTAFGGALTLMILAIQLLRR